MTVLVTGRRRPVRGGSAIVSRPGEESVGRREQLAVAAIVLAGLGLRLVGLATFPYEQDELYTLIESTELFGTRLQPGIDARPLYYLLQHAVLWVAEPSPLALRFLPLVFGTLGIFATWILGRWTLGATAGVVAAILVAVSPWHLHASGMARYWSLVYLLAAVVYFLLQYSNERDRRGAYLATLGTLVAGTLTHPTFVFPIVGAAVAMLLVSEDGRVRWRWPSRRAWTWLWGPYAAVLIIGFLALRITGNESAVRNWGGRGLGATLRLVPAMVEWMTPVVFAAGALGAFALLFSTVPRARRWGAMATLGVAGGLAALVAASLVTDTYADYGIAMLPLVFVSAGGLVELGARSVRSGMGARLATIATLVLLAGVLPSTVSHLRDGTRFDYRPAFEQIADDGPDLLVATTPIVLQRAYAPALRAVELTGDPERLDALLAAEREMWVVASVSRHGTMADEGGRLVGWLRSNCRLVHDHERLRLDYRRYRVELWRCSAATEAAPTGVA